MLVFLPLTIHYACTIVFSHMYAWACFSHSLVLTMVSTASDWRRQRGRCHVQLGRSACLRAWMDAGPCAIQSGVYMHGRAGSVRGVVHVYIIIIVHMFRIFHVYFSNCRWVQSVLVCENINLCMYVFVFIFVYANMYIQQYVFENFFACL